MMRWVLNLPGLQAAPVLFALLTAGCSLIGPDYVRPSVAVSPNWLDTGDRRVQSSTANYRSWWKAFDDPALDKLIETAYRDNLPLRVAGVRVLEARAQLGIAVGNIYPQMQQVTGSLQHNEVSHRAVQAAFSRVFNYTQSEIGLTASWEIDFWGKFRRAIQSADSALLAAVADYDNTLVSLTADVANSYILIRTLEARLDIARQNAALQLENFRIAEARFEGGTTSKRDVEQAQAVLAATQATIPALEIQLRQTKNALSVLLGMPPSHLRELLAGSKGIPAPPPQVAVGIPADLLRRRPDVRSAELQAAAESAKIGVAKAALFPAFSLTGSFAFLATDFGAFSLQDMFRWRSHTSALGPAVQWNIFNYGQITNQVRAQDARFQELLISYQNAVLTAQREVEDNLVSFLRMQERARLLGESTAAALRSLNLATLQYRQGITDFTTVLTAQQELLSQQENLAGTLGDISRSLVGVYRALGGGWEIREDQDLVPPAIQQVMAQRTNWGSLLSPSAVPLNPAPEKSLIRSPQW